MNLGIVTVVFLAIAVAIAVVIVLAVALPNVRGGSRTRVSGRVRQRHTSRTRR